MLRIFFCTSATLNYDTEKTRVTGRTGFNLSGTIFHPTYYAAAHMQHFVKFLFRVTKMYKVRTPIGSSDRAVFA